LVRAVNLERLSNNPVLVDEEQLVAIIGREAGQL
jgi:hypothetical protein